MITITTASSTSVNPLRVFGLGKETLHGFLAPYEIEHLKGKV